MLRNVFLLLFYRKTLRKAKEVLSNGEQANYSEEEWEAIEFLSRMDSYFKMKYGQNKKDLNKIRKVLLSSQ